MKRLRILHLEDDPLDGELLLSTLAGAGIACDLLRVDTGPDFIEALQHGDFGLVISDLSLPSFDGRAALEIVRQQYPDIPFIFVSGTIGEEAAIESLLSGATDYVLKHKFSRLVPAVRRAEREADDRRMRRQTEEDLARTSTQLQNLFDNLDDVFFSLDTIQTRLLQLSPSCERFFGTTAQEFFDNTVLWKQCIDDRDKGMVTQVESDLRRGRAVQCECRIVRRNGTRGWIEAKLKPMLDQTGFLVRVDGVLRETTARKRAEEALRASEERYRHMFDSSPLPMWVHDAKTLVFLAVNNAAVSGYGFSREEFLRMTIGEIEASEGLPVLSDYVRDNPALEGLPEWRHKKRNGTIIDVEMASHEVPFAGKPARLVVVHDITEKKRMESQSLRAQRVETIGTLASGIAHDLNNILAPLVLGLELLRENASDDRNNPIIETLELNAHRGVTLVKQILTFARGIESRRGMLQIRTLLGDIERFLTLTMPKSIRIENSVERDLWLVPGDSTQLHQLVMNLCVNARDAMPDGGTIRLAARNLTVNHPLRRRAFELKPGSYVVLEVSDEGQGISEELLDRIFEPFFTTKPEGSGTGLGLSTAQMIAKGHGGFLDVNTTPGRGTAFVAYLSAISAVRGASVGERPHPAPEGAGELILVVDDEVAIQDIVRKTLETHGYKVLTASNGKEGLEVFIEHRAEIQAVLSDMHMPIMNGETMIGLMTAMNPSLRVVCGSGMPRDDTSGLETSARRVILRKPFSADELLRAFHKALDQSPDIEAV